MPKLITDSLLEKYNKYQKFTLEKKVNALAKRKLDIQPFAFVVSSVYSSLIEGGSIDIEKYVNYQATKNNSTDMIEVQDLMAAYNFAKSNTLTTKNVVKAHQLLSKHFNIDAKYKGAIRDKNVSVGSLFITVYEGANKKIVLAEFEKLMKEIGDLKKRKMSYNEMFYYASFIHLLFLKIHPFADGNGRLGRLLEKWFLASVIGEDAWLIPSEVYYQISKKTYYQYLDLGDKYENINTEKAIDFLLMLPSCFSLSTKKYMFKE
jgi:Fic family protein